MEHLLGIYSLPHTALDTVDTQMSTNDVFPALQNLNI